MPKPPKAFDVWFVAANTVYKAVPYNVVADWAQQSRLAPTDMVRPAGAKVAWVSIADHEFLSDYLARPSAAKAVQAAPPTINDPVAGPTVAQAHPIGDEQTELPDPEPIRISRRGGDEDDDVDMIPLIDISMVLLVFFIMIRAAGAIAPVDVPEMKYAGQLSNDPEALTISIEKLDEEKVYYSVRRGPSAPQEKHDLLATPEEAVKALDELLASSQRPPEVRIACRKDLPRERVYELRRELEGRQKKGHINSFTATVIEAPQDNK